MGNIGHFFGVRGAVLCPRGLFALCVLLRIVVANLHGDVIKTIACKSGVCRQCIPSGGCTDPVQPLPHSTETRGVLANAFDAISELFAEKPERYSIHRVRGGELGVVKSSVVRLDGTNVELESVVKQLESGLYEFSFVPLSELASGPREVTSVSSNVEWKPDRPLLVPAQRVRPGLYEVHVSHNESSGAAWVLVCSREAYDQTVALFHEFIAQTEHWDGSVSDETKQASQRAYLDYLASQQIHFR